MLIRSFRMQKQYKYNSESGFSLIEVLLVVALIAMAAGISATLYTDYQTRNELDLTAQKVTQAIRTAQTNAQSMKNNSTWGVYVTNNEITVFEGVDYATRNTDSDFTLEVSGRVNHSGIGEIIFSKYYGVPDTTGDINLTAINGSTAQLVINEKGVVDY
ncbi:prepilin-type N-terminal cleavage/methylation domain-containing protein [Candidatus Dojkabacteria bacterium]|nr:prepilin-type N-terminal cleavage/methylation domain-containing protein [Candidatus Dojkabacteria bacterium]